MMAPEQEALLCANASEIIYGDGSDPEGDKTTPMRMSQLGFSSHYIPFSFETETKDFRGFLVSSDEYHLLAFRGTKEPQDWLTDALFAEIAFNSVFEGAPVFGLVHGGFARCLNTDIKQVVAALKNRDRTKPLLITGHSLGGALAVLAAAYITALQIQAPPISRVYTFGQPRVGLKDFCDLFAQNVSAKLVRFVNNDDIVPRVPLQRSSFLHTGVMIHFDDSGRSNLETTCEPTDLFMSVKRAFEGPGGVMNVGNVFAGDHSVIRYRQLVAVNKTELARILKSI